MPPVEEVSGGYFEQQQQQELPDPDQDYPDDEEQGGPRREDFSFEEVFIEDIPQPPADQQKDVELTEDLVEDVLGRKLSTNVFTDRVKEISAF